MRNIFGAVKADFVAYNKLTTGLRHDLRIFARISEFPCFHETKQAQNEVEKVFSTTWPDLFSNTFATVGEFQRLLQSFVSIRFSQHDRTVLHVIQRARAQAPLHLPHKFFDVKSFYKILPLLPIVITKSRQNASGICSRHAVFVRRLGDVVSAKRNANRGRGL